MKYISFTFEDKDMYLYIGEIIDRVIEILEEDIDFGNDHKGKDI